MTEQYWARTHHETAPEIGQRIWIDVEPDIDADDEHLRTGRIPCRIVEVGAHWSAPGNGQSGYHVLVETEQQ